MAAESAFFSGLSDAELRGELERNGVNVGPINPSTRKVYEIKLLRIAQKHDNAEEYVKNLSFSEKNNRNGTPEPATTNGVGSRNGSPMPVQPLNFELNGASSDQKKQPARSAKQEQTPSNGAVGGGTKAIGHIDIQHPDSQRKTIYVEDHGDHSSDDDANESARTLSSEEVAKFRCGFSSHNSTDELMSDIAASSASKSMFSPSFYYNHLYKRQPAIANAPAKNDRKMASTPLLLLALGFFVMLAVAIIFRTNWEHLSGFNAGGQIKDEI